MEKYCPYITKETLNKYITDVKQIIEGAEEGASEPEAEPAAGKGPEEKAAEAKKLGIPVIGLADSNVNPEGVEIVIPGNDDAIRSIELIASAIADACLKGSGKRSEVENKEKE